MAMMKVVIRRKSVILFPKFTFGLTNNFEYKNFDLTIVATGTYGNKIAAAVEQGMANLDGPFNVMKEVKDRRRPRQSRCRTLW